MALIKTMPLTKPLTRRFVLSAATAAAAFGLDRQVAFLSAAQAQETPAPAQPFHRFTVGSVEVTAIYDGIFEKPHDPAFIKNATVDDTKDALGKAGLPTNFVSIPLTVLVLKIGEGYVMVDAGSGAGQWQPTAVGLAPGLKAAGIDPAKIHTILISHFHPDHIFGLLEKGTNAPVFPKAELVVSESEYKWWTEPGRVEKLPEARKPLGQRINSTFPTWKNFRLVAGEAEVAPGIRLLPAPGHTPGHSAFLLTSGNGALLLSNDTAYVPALLAPHPEWQGSYDQDSVTAVETRRRLLDRAVVDRLLVAGAHFPFPGTGRFEKDGAGYAFTPVRA